MSDDPLSPGEWFVNPIHAGFAFTALGKDADVEALIRLLDELDPFERDRLLDPLFFTFYEDPREFPTEEERIEYSYAQFKVHCRKLHVLDYFIVHGIVLQVLNWYRNWSDESHADRSVEHIRGFIEFSRTRGTSEHELEKWKIMAESNAVTKKSDLQVNRRLYNLFCERVALPLMQLK